VSVCKSLGLGSGLSRFVFVSFLFPLYNVLVELSFYRNLKEALDSLGEGEALCTDSYLTLFPLTVLYRWEGTSGKYLGLKLVKGKIAKPEVLSYSRTKSDASKFGVGQVYVRKEKEGPALPVSGLSGMSLSSFYRLALLRSEDLSKRAEELYSSLRLNRNAFAPYFYSFVSSGLREIASIGGDYVGLGVYSLVRGEEAYSKSSIVIQVIRENIAHSLEGIGVDFNDLDHTPIEEEIKDYLSFLVSVGSGSQCKGLIEFVDRDLDFVEGIVGRIVSTKWFDDRGLSIFDVEGNEHLERALKGKVKSMGLTKSQEGIREVKKLLPNFVGRFMVSFSSLDKADGGSVGEGDFSNFVAIPIGYRNRKRGKPKSSVDELEVDYLILSRVRLEKCEVEYGITRSTEIEEKIPYIDSLDRIIDPCLSESRRGTLVLEESRLVGKETRGYGEGDERRVIRVIIDSSIYPVEVGAHNERRNISQRKFNTLLNTPDFSLMIDLDYFLGLSKNYYLDFELTDDYRLVLLGLSSTEPIIWKNLLSMSFFASKELVSDQEREGMSNLDCSETDMVRRIYEFVDSLIRFISSKRSSIKGKAESKTVSYFLSILEELKRVLSSKAYYEKFECKYDWRLQRFYFKIPDFGYLFPPGLPLNPGDIFKQEDFDSPLSRYLSRLHRSLLEGQELCARVGEETHRFPFKEGLDLDIVESKILGKVVEGRHRPEVEASRSKAGLKDIDPKIANFSWSLSSNIVSSLVVYEKDNPFILGTPWLEGIVRKLVLRLVSVLTEGQEHYYSYPEPIPSFSTGDKRLPVLNIEGFLSSLEYVYVKVSFNVVAKIKFSCDNEGNFDPNYIEVSFPVDYSKTNTFDELKRLDFYLPSGVPGKSLKVSP